MEPQLVKTTYKFPCSCEKVNGAPTSFAALAGPSQRAPEDIPAGAARSERRKEEVSRQLVQKDDVVQ